MSQDSSCPRNSDLVDLLQGKIAEPTLSELVAHLETCEECLRRARMPAAEDSIVRSLKGKAETNGLAEGTPRVLIDRIKRFARPDAAPPSPPAEAEATSLPLGENSDESDAPAGDLSNAEAELGFLAPAQTPGELGRLGAYRILKVLGKGGMGMVLLAAEPNLDRLVAIKVMLPAIAARGAAKARFLREARAVAKINSDHIVNVLAVGEDQGVPFFVMEYLEGEPLDRRLASAEPLPLLEILRIGREIALGLQAAHAAGLIHRDIKPGNLWLDKARHGRVKILDFGLARAEKDDIQVTRSGDIVGTPAYMAPEQARGEKSLDFRVDLFSLGCVLYRLCTGQLPFRGETYPAIILEIAIKDPAPPIRLNDQIPRDLSDLTMDLLQKDAGRRPASAGEVVARLDSIAIACSQSDSAGIKPTPFPLPQARSPGAAPKGTRDPRAETSPRKKRSRWLPASLVLAALVGTIALSVFVIRLVTGEGTLVVEVEGKGIEVTIDGSQIKLVEKPADAEKAEEKKLLRSGSHDLRIRVGKDSLPLGPAGTVILKDRKIVVTLDDAELRSHQFDIYRGKERVLKIRSEPTKLAAGDPATGREISKAKQARQFPANQWTRLFNGANLDGWAIARPRGGESWRVESGMLVATARDRNTSWLLTDETFDNFQLRFEFKMTPTANSGFTFNADPSSNSYQEISIITPDHPPLRDDPTIATGGMSTLSIDEAPKLKPFGEWNTMEIQVTPLRVHVKVNGHMTLDRSPDFLRSLRPEEPAFTRTRGRIGFESWTGDVYFKNIEIMPYPLGTDFSKDLPEPIVPSPADRALLARLEGEWHATTAKGKVRPRIIKGAFAYQPKDLSPAPVRVKGHTLRITWPNGGEIVTVDPKGEMKVESVGTHDGQHLTWKRVHSGPIDLTKGFTAPADAGPSGRNLPADAPPFALEFAGNGARVEIPNFSIEPATPFTLEMWIKPKTDEPRAMNFFFQNRGGELYVHDFHKFNVVFQRNNGDKKLHGIAEAQVPLQSWTHLSGTFDGRSVQVFLNGKKSTIQTANYDQPSKSPEGLTLLGMGFHPESGRFDMPFLGQMTAVRVSKGVRYPANFTPTAAFHPDADTLALYRFDEGKGDVLRDSSGNNRHGDILGARWVRTKVANK